MNRIKPISIDVSNSEQKLRIEWGDGLKVDYPLFGLRKNCPCVVCRGGHENMGRFETKLFFIEPTREYRVQSAKPVGNHALKIDWNDGHNTGMYRWDLLRQMGEAIIEKEKK